MLKGLNSGKDVAKDKKIDLYFSEILGLSLHEFIYLRKIPIMFQKQ